MLLSCICLSNIMPTTSVVIHFKVDQISCLTLTGNILVSLRDQISRTDSDLSYSIHLVSQKIFPIFPSFHEPHVRMEHMLTLG